MLHAAGALADAPLLSPLASPRALRATGSAKQQALSACLRAFGGGGAGSGGAALSAVPLFSSLSTLLGTPGQAAYCAANAQLDASAAALASAGLPAVSMQWGPWKQQVQSRGMLSASPGAAARFAAAGLGLLRASSGLAALEALGDLGGGGPLLPLALAPRESGSGSGSFSFLPLDEFGLAELEGGKAGEQEGAAAAAAAAVAAVAEAAAAAVAAPPAPPPAAPVPPPPPPPPLPPSREETLLPYSKTALALVDRALRRVLGLGATGALPAVDEPS